MNSTNFWDDPDLSTAGEFVSFNNIGDTVTGTIVRIRKHVWDDGSVSPQILLDCDGTERTVTAGQVRLKAELAAKKPQPGEVITITLSDIEKRAGGKTLKHFTVVVGNSAPAAAVPAAVPAAAAAAPVSGVLPPGDYTPAQLIAFQSLGMQIPS